MLEVDNVNVFYGEVKALWDVSLKVREGEVVVLLGSNGAGKTTLLKTILSLSTPASGAVKFRGDRIDVLPPHRVVEKGISIVPQEGGIFPEMSVLENLLVSSFGGKGGREDILNWIYEIFPILEERKNQSAGTLSGGEQQMLGIGQALMSKPELLLLDEPSSGLMPKLLPVVFDTIERLNESGLSILLAEQNIYYALKAAERGYLLENGRLVFSGTRGEIKESEKVKNAYMGIGGTA